MEYIIVESNDSASNLAEKVNEKLKGGDWIPLGPPTILRFSAGQHHAFYGYQAMTRTK